MSDVFVSYKSGDATRVVRLVRALESAGFSVWWDRRLVAGANWRFEIEQALEAAPCVLVIWTEESVGPKGDFVKDEAARAQRRGALIPVKLSTVNPPLGFGEMQAIDLSHWNGSSRDPFLQDLIAAVKAKIEGHEAPPPKGPTKRLIRRVTYGSAASALLACASAFAANALQMQDRACRLPIFQPSISDVCGALGLGNRPARAERIACERRDRGSCAALRTHIERFPDGFYRTEASALLAARRVTEVEIWKLAERRLALFQPESEVASPDKSNAQARTTSEAQTGAQRLCRGFAATSISRLKSARPVSQQWNCSSTSEGVRCGFEGEAVCELEEQHWDSHETCGM